MADDTKSWNTKHYILAALAGTLAATATVIIVSVILSPAGIHFYVTHASKSPTADGGANLNFTVDAINTSRRAAVKYLSISVDVKNSTSSAGKHTIFAQVDTELPTKYLLGPSNLTSFNASVNLVGGDLGLLQSFAGQIDRLGLIVLVTAEVRFRIGLARTRVYDIRASCPRVLFPELTNGTSSPLSSPQKCA